MQTEDESSLAVEETDGVRFQVYAASIYQGLSQKLIRKIKYDGDRLIAQDLGLLIYKAIERSFAETELGKSFMAGVCQFSPVIIPVPLHKKRLRKRGYNQSHEIAKALAQLLPFKPEIKTDLLERIADTRPQFDLDFLERHSNVINAFRSRKCLDPEKHYVILDDVFTTGTTIKECVKILTKSGAIKVSALLVSRAVL